MRSVLLSTLILALLALLASALPSSHSTHDHVPLSSRSHTKREAAYIVYSQFSNLPRTGSTTSVVEATGGSIYHFRVDADPGKIVDVLEALEWVPARQQWTELQGIRPEKRRGTLSIAVEKDTVLIFKMQFRSGDNGGLARVWKEERAWWWPFR